MAYAKLLQPRGGDTVGVDGVDLFEHFYVEIDDEGDDPIAVLQDRLEDDPFSRTGVPIGQSHPDQKYATALVRNYRVMESGLGHLGSIVLVYYTTPEIPAVNSVIVPGWRFSTSVVGRTRRLLRDLDNKLIGGRASKFIDVRPPGAVDYKAWSTIEKKEIDVELAGADEVISPVGNAGIEIDDGIFAFTLRRSTLAMSTIKLLSAKSALFKCNHDAWRGYAAKTVLIADVRIEEDDYFKQGSNRRYQYPVTVELWQADKDWTKEEVPIFYEEDRQVAPVYTKTGSTESPYRLEATSYRVRDTIDLPGFLATFEGNNP